MKKINSILCTIFSALVIIQYVFSLHWHIIIQTAVKILCFVTYSILVLPDIVKYIKCIQIRRLSLKACQLFESKKYEDELKILNKLVKLEPISHNYSLRGSVYSTLHKYNEAIADYSHAIALNTMQYDHYKSRAFCYDHINCFEKSIADYLKALQLKPEDEDLMLFLAHSYSDNKEYKNAVVYYDRVLKLNPNEIEAYIGKGICCNRLKKHEDAINVYKLGLKADANAAALYVNIGVAYSDMGLFDLSKSYYDKAIEIDANNYFSYYNRGILLYAQANYHDAVADFTKVAELNATLIDAYVWLAKSYRLLGDLYKAQYSIKKAKELKFSLIKIHD